MAPSPGEIKFSAASLRWWRRRLQESAPDTPISRADLLACRMAMLGLDVDAVARAEPVTLGDLQRVCAACKHEALCGWDLRQHPTDSAGWDYCPNSATLDALDALPWFWTKCKAPWSLF
jgi:Family of unknown function (DUF6455)